MKPAGLKSVTKKAHTEALEGLVGFMRDNGLTSYRGPLIGDGWRVELEVELGAPVHKPLPVKREKEQPTEAPKRGPDGLTQDEQVELYGEAKDVF